MTENASIPSIPSAHVARASCPKCRSIDIVTKEKKPAADAYWRCTACGEMWNASRKTREREGGNRWWR